MGLTLKKSLRGRVSKGTESMGKLTEFCGYGNEPIGWKIDVNTKHANIKSHHWT
jgi:hypothetical protein